MSKTIRARTMDRAHRFTDPFSQAHCFDEPQSKKIFCLIDSSSKKNNFIIFYHYQNFHHQTKSWFQLVERLHKFMLNRENSAPQYFDIDHLSRLAQEESYTMPRGLTREQRREWARKNLER